MDPDISASPARAVLLTVRFLVELALLAGTAVLVWRVAPTGGWQWVAVILGPILVAVVWGLFLSPKAAVTIPSIAALMIEAGLFLGVGAGLFAVGLAVPAAIGVAVWALDRLLLAVTS